jgi:hypothetical protein
MNLRGRWAYRPCRRNSIAASAIEARAMFLSLVGALDPALQSARRSPGEDVMAGIAGQVVMIFLDGIRTR